MTNYTLTQDDHSALKERLAYGQIESALELLRSLKPNSQEPVGYQYKDRDGNWCNFMNEKHLADTRADGSWPIRAIYTHPALISKEDMVKVLEALQEARTCDDSPQKWDRNKEAFLIMQSAIEGMK